MAELRLGILLNAITWFLLTTRVVGQFWQSLSYNGNPIAEDNVGGVIFDAGIGTSNPQCFGASTGTLSISIISCPLGNLIGYLSVSNSKIVLASAYYLSVNGHSSTVPDCIIACTETTNGTSVYSYLTVYIYSTNNYAPTFNNSFPTVLTLTTFTVPQWLVRTDAFDLDLDKTTNGYVTYSVSTIDGSPVIAGSTDYIQYQSNGTTPNLYLQRNPPWSSSTTHTILIAALDNPLNTTARKTTTTSLTIKYQLSVTSTSTTTTTTGTGSTSTSTSLNAGTTAAQSSQSTSTSCNGINILICGNNWIYLTIGVVGFVLLILTISLLAYFLSRRGKTAPSPQQPPRQPAGQQARAERTQRNVPPPHYRQQDYRLPPENQQRNPFSEVYNYRPKNPDPRR